MPPNQTVQLENEDAELLPAFEKKGYRTVPLFWVNGQPVAASVARQARPHMTLLEFLRTCMRLTGSKLGCAEGGCGACTVMLSKRVRDNAVEEDELDDSAVRARVPQTTVKHYSVNACLMPVLAADGCHITTVEGVGSLVQSKGGLHPVQQAMVDMHGSQCGFCTPGIVVSLYTLLSNSGGRHTQSSSKNKVEHLQEHLDGNLCRCTGYRPIWDAAQSLCVDTETVVKGPCGTPCVECFHHDTCEQDCNQATKEKESAMMNREGMCTTSSLDKVKTYKDTFLKDTLWLDQPNQMFPQELRDTTSEINRILQQPLMVVDRNAVNGGTWIQPTTIEGLVQLLDEFQGNCKLVVGNTEVGIEARFKHAKYQRLIYPSHSIWELFAPPVVLPHGVLTVGSGCPLSVIQETCREIATASPNSTNAQQDVRVSRTCIPMHDMLRWFASTQIRNVACLGGNLVTASPISDMNPLLASMGASLVLTHWQEQAEGGLESPLSRRVCAVSEFFMSYRKVQLQSNEVVECIQVPLVETVFEYVKPFKQARRREDDISIVTSGMKLTLGIQDGVYVVEKASLAFGGMAPTTVLANKTAEALVGNEFCAVTFEEAVVVLMTELTLPTAVPGGQAAYRMTLAASFLKKFFLLCAEGLCEDVKRIQADPDGFPQFTGISMPSPPTVDESELSGTQNFLSEKKPSFSGTQSYPVPKTVAKGVEEELLPPVEPPVEAKEKKDGPVVGKAVTHQSGPLHCTGEALYVDDIPEPPGTLQSSLLMTKACGGVFQSIDTTLAFATPGVVAIYTHQDLVSLGGRNEMGPIQLDELVFLPPGEVVRTVGQVLGIVVAETLEAAELGARLVKVKYEEPNSNIIVSIQDAIQANSFYEFSRHALERGDVSALDALSSIPDTISNQPTLGQVVKVSGEFHSGAQEHFYLETNGTMVVPSEADTNLTVYCSSQAPTKTQNFCASATNTPAAKVVVRVKRMGGGFGGKETRSVFVSAAVAVAAKILVRPVKCILPRDVDMKTTGTRHAFMSKYQASAEITKDGAKLLSLDIKLYNNGGCCFDLSGPVMDRALFHVDGCYKFPNLRCEGVVCKTVQPPHTAYRGFGGPQGMAANEHVLEHLALACKISVEKLRRSNLYQAGDSTHFGMIIGEEDSGKWNIPTMWDRMEKEAGVAHRRQHISEFNSKNMYLKRGLAMVPTKFGIAYTAKYMNQGGALVHLYTDGTVLVSHGGTEMGQGLHTKVCQVAAQAFGIPIEHVHVEDSSTDKVANTIPTAASMSTDTYGMATLDACRQILARLKPIRQELGVDAPLKEVAKKAHFSRIDLSAHGFFAVNDMRCGFDWNAEKPSDFDNQKQIWNSWKGHPFNYFTQGIACTEVEVDLLTGNHKTLRSDVMVDVGSSINPTIDIGQIEGAFTQGMGWSTIEDVVYGDDDHTWIRPRGTVFTSGPGTYKIPSFNDTPEIFNVSLLDKVDNPFAVHSSKAIGEPPFYLGASVFYAIKDAIFAARQDGEYFEMRMPATSERIRMYVADPLACMAVQKVAGEDASGTVFQPQGSF